MTTIEQLEARVAVLEATVASTGTVLPVRAWTEQEAAALREEFPGGADETYTETVKYRDVSAAREWFLSIFTVYGAKPKDLGNLPHNVLQVIPLYASISGSWPLAAPQPFPGYTGPTYDPQEIYARALTGQSWTGDAPCGDEELARRTAIRDNIVANVPGANGTDWYMATADAATVLVMGTGFNPYSHELHAGDGYPCPGVYDLDGVCKAITGGGTPG